MSIVNNFNSKDFTTEVLTDEQRQNPELMKNSDLYQKCDVSVYYGSMKDGIENVCLTCKKRIKCEDYYDIVTRQEHLRKATYNPKFAYGFKQEELEKLRNNVFIAIKCVNKEEE